MFATTAADAQTVARNIVFIAIDDLRNWVNYAGDYAGTVHTPNIDALAAVSTRYLNAYTAVPQCAGSRTTIMLGQSPATHGIKSAAISSSAYDDLYNDPGTVTLPEVLSQHGYHTAVAGKVVHKPEPARWDESGPATIIANLPGIGEPGPDNTFISATVLPASEEHPDQTVANWAIDFIDNYTAPEPFFLAVGFYQPHLPWRIPQWAYDLYPPAEVVTYSPPADDLGDEPPEAVELALAPLLYGVLPQDEVVRSAGKTADYTRAYLAAVSHTDAMVGAVLSTLASSVHAANTDIILWSDHGFHLGEKFHWRKSTFWEPAVKVPMLISSPGNSDYPVGDVNDVVSLLDLAPTVLDLLELSPYSGFEGAPLHDAVNRSPVRVYLEGGRATILNGMKTIDYDLAAPGVEHRSRYDLATDPQELVRIVPTGC